MCRGVCLSCTLGAGYFAAEKIVVTLEGFWRTCVTLKEDYLIKSKHIFVRITMIFLAYFCLRHVDPLGDIR
jgi:hypothetical protein